ncbi:hypothetical protein WJ0W_002147 [Paenibacillus melissococcoides]|uniref:Uncharacterized protein n=1 Tax=Paenibacillus melissococcoides TaxID=2912268 RepID=A0ABM9G0D1_9BACL|nr:MULTISPECIES: hypothetical protein [Paenibacillus]MEB9894953.1 hypothetical protein [Bacillus cereus]CAH8244916.1 hypothetical protein WJ0W_002147 [Paenibacillus melissococcoides]CAH8709357.1 hypothetical protein WDD9_002228 [Paenibacillus melissococcoides]CAH8710084.1 hypothetical protein HTL2_002516 [Paenibacillus melissococcoides]GIO79862.1 hypothetical protein J6TS7_34720 [Paenibacillus dendritiformis]
MRAPEFDWGKLWGNVLAGLVGDSGGSGGNHPPKTGPREKLGENAAAVLRILSGTHWQKNDLNNCHVYKK